MEGGQHVKRGWWTILSPHSSKGEFRQQCSLSSSSEALLHLQRERERWGGGLLCPSWNMPSYKIRTKPCLAIRKDVPPLQGPQVPFLTVTCTFIMSPRWRHAVHLPHPFTLAMTSSWPNNQGQPGNGKSILKIAAFPCSLPPPPSSSQKVGSPVRCQVDDSKSQMCHAQLVNNRLSNRAINLLARWLLCPAAMPLHSQTH